MARPTLISLAIAAVWIAGCDSREGTSAVSTPSTQPAVVEPTTQSAPEPVASFLQIGDRMPEFPPARLRLETEDSTVRALLYSASPRDTDRPRSGNSYYFEMLLDIEDPTQLEQALWHFESATSDPVDSPQGIFLDGTRKHLQPNKVMVEFEGEGSPMTVHIRGNFLMFDTTDGRALPQAVYVSGTLVATVEHGE